jgi:hypothetical protein
MLPISTTQTPQGMTRRACHTSWRKIEFVVVATNG